MLLLLCSQALPSLPQTQESLHCPYCFLKYASVPLFAYFLSACEFQIILVCSSLCSQWLYQSRLNMKNKNWRTWCIRKISSCGTYTKGKPWVAAEAKFSWCQSDSNQDFALRCTVAFPKFFYTTWYQLRGLITEKGLMNCSTLSGQQTTAGSSTLVYSS